MAAATEHAERGGRGSGIRIGDKLSPVQRTVVEQLQASLGSPPGTILLGVWCVALEDASEGTRVEEVEPPKETEQQAEEVEQAEQP